MALPASSTPCVDPHRLASTKIFPQETLYGSLFEMKKVNRGQELIQQPRSTD